MPVLVPGLDPEIALDRFPGARFAPAPPVVSELADEVGKVSEARCVVVSDSTRGGESATAKFCRYFIRWLPCRATGCEPKPIAA
jgi:hypothetical protein